MTPTSRTGRPTRPDRVALALGAGPTVSAAVGAQAAPVPRGGTHPQPTRLETLGVAFAVTPAAVSRSRVVTVEVHVVRRAADVLGARDRVPGATVALRITTGATTTHAWGHTDDHGVATLQLTPRSSTPLGPATLTAEAWSTPETPLGCAGTVEEHGLVEQGTRVVR
ncbi:MAG TPA: hypothetical protein VNA14_13405 [Mycobacteriales bacterium]|nr:hypothetical protein [Mycobacteriales bacterium]